MNFSEVIGQDDVKNRLLTLIESGKMPHSLLLYGAPGCGKMALALALASHLLGENDANNPKAASVKAMLDRWEHPDLHFSYPVIRPTGTTADHKMISDDFAKEWHVLLKKGPYFDMDAWLEQMNAANQQAIIFASESDNLTRKLNLKSSLGGYKVSIIWLPERMNVECANKLLKLLEEPPHQTIFIMVSEAPERLLETVRSRTQMIQVKRIDTAVLERALVEKRGLDGDTARRVAQIANGSWLDAIRMLNADSEAKQFFNDFVGVMRASYRRDIREMKAWSERVATYGREKQKRMLLYFHRMFRENFMYNFKQDSLIHFTQDEEQFAQKFAPFINERNIVELYELVELNIRDLSQNANPKIVFFDFTLRVTMLLVRK
ncbi:ATP-binding protein [Hoylesella nanceiensis]|jgi:DNA polymerase III, gamma and tau subunit protein|uniref:DNA polymerase III subunit n=1 Tax=Hoylesella nanceiensis TaxID=425941 RepID=UPI0024A89D76|nr:ATP-binding protein [Hoylesella nanceiensis]